MIQHLPVLQVVVPLLSAPICVLFGRRRFAYGFSLAVSWVTFAISILLLREVVQGGVISYHIGDWAPPWGIEYRVDLVNAYVLLIVSAIGALVLTYGKPSVDREIEPERHYLFYTTYLLCLTGLLGVAVTGDAFNIFVFFEISSLSSYILISLGANRRALTASLNYLVFGTIGATFFLIGVGLLYQMTGTLNIADLAQRVAPLHDNRTVQVAFIFMAIGLAVKAAVFPLHAWLPNAYAYAPSTVSTFLAATATKVAIYVLIRTFFTIFGVSFSFGAMSLGSLLLTLSIVAMIVGSTIAIFQDDIKRMLAYSSIAQIGYMVLGIGFATVTGVAGGILHLFNHALIKTSLFMAMGCVFYRMGSVRIEAMAGIGRRMPWTTAAFVAGGLCLIGVPLTTGFVSKWYLLLAAIDSGMWWISIFILISSLLAIIYVWRVVETAYFDPSPEGAPEGEAPLLMLIPTWVLIAANVYFGIDTRVSVGVALKAAKFLIGAGS